MKQNRVGNWNIIAKENRWKEKGCFRYVLEIVILNCDSIVVFILCLVFWEALWLIIIVKKLILFWQNTLTTFHWALFSWTIFLFRFIKKLYSIITEDSAKNRQGAQVATDTTDFQECNKRREAGGGLPCPIFENRLVSEKFFYYIMKNLDWHFLTTSAAIHGALFS